MYKSVAELRAEMREAEKREAAEREARKALVQVKRRYTILPQENHSMFGRIYDSTCKYYELRCAVLNLVEATEAGYASHELTEGSGRYLYNTATGSIVCAVSGGTFYISPGWKSTQDDLDVAAFEEINEFLLAHPEGGIITDIVERFQTARKETDK